MPPEMNINISSFTKRIEIGRKKAKKGQGREEIGKEGRENHKHYYASRNQNKLVPVYHKQ